MLGFCVQLATLHGLTRVFGIDYLVAVVAAVEAAILHNFIWHERWTWRDRRFKAGTPLGRLVRFNTATGAVSLLGNVVLTAAFVELAALPVLVANMAAIIILTGVNYLIADRLTFAARPVRSRMPAAAGARAIRRRIAAIGLTSVVLLGVQAPTEAAGPTVATLGAWEQYVASVENRHRRDSREASRVLTLDAAGGQQGRSIKTRIVGGDIVVENVTEMKVTADDGTISHWRGFVFIPGATIDSVLEIAAARGPRLQYPKEEVLDFRVMSRDGNSLRLYLKLQRKAIVTAAYNSEHLVSLERLGPGRAASRSVSVRIAELRDVGTPREREKSPDEDRGFLWRLNAYWRYQAMNDGVLVELESLTLSRDVPWGLRAVASPVIDRIARESMTRTLDAIRSSAAATQ
jgi:putative flippase GtrA